MKKVKDILKQRGETYGDYEDVSRTAQQLKDGIRLSPEWVQLSFPQKESIDMICNKLARIVNGKVEWLDSWYDILGYAQLVIDTDISLNEKVQRSLFGSTPLMSNENLQIKTTINAIIYELNSSAANPKSVVPYKNIISLVQTTIDILESEGKVRVQH